MRNGCSTDSTARVERLAQGDPAQLDRPLGRRPGLLRHPGSERKLEIFTTRPDTIFGVTFMVIAPEHEWVGELTTAENRSAVEEYIAQARKRSDASASPRRGA